MIGMNTLPKGFVMVRRGVLGCHLTSQRTVLVGICFRDQAVHEILTQLLLELELVHINLVCAFEGREGGVTQTNDTREVSSGGILEVGRRGDVSIDLTYRIVEEFCTVLRILVCYASVTVCPTHLVMNFAFYRRQVVSKEYVNAICNNLQNSLPWTCATKKNLIGT
jgi:hypothetical protein